MFEKIKEFFNKKELVFNYYFHPDDFSDKRAEAFNILEKIPAEKLEAVCELLKAMA